MTLKLKISLLVSTVILIFLLAIIILAYCIESNALFVTTMERHVKIASQMAQAVAGIVDSEIALITAEAEAGYTRSAARDAGSRYAAMNEKDISPALMDIDRNWMKASPDDPLVKEYLENKLSLRLKEIKKDGEISSIIVTDKFGGLIGSTTKPQAFYQANEDWWQGSYADGAGGLFIGNPVFDDAAGTWDLPFAAPVKDESGEFLGVFKASVNINTFFKPLADFTLGESGEAVLVDDKGYLIFSRKAQPFTAKFCEYRELEKCLKSANKWCVVNTAYLHAGYVLAAYAEIAHPIFLSRPIHWYVVIEQDRKEILAPLNKLKAGLIIIAPLFILLSLFSTFILTKAFTNPIDALREGMRHIGTGDLDYRVPIGSLDELGKLIDSFNGMADGLKKTVVSISNLKKESTLREKAERLTLDTVSIAAQLRETLTGIKAEIRAAIEELPDRTDEEKEKLIGMRERAIDRFMRNIDNLSDIAKVETGKIDLKRELVDIRDLMKKVIFVFEPKIRSKGLDFKLELPKEAPAAYVDKAKINQVFNTLIENAIKFTEKGTIKITVMELKTDVEISISDTGVGIALDNINMVFERFQGRDPALQSKAGGAGLSLSLAKEIIDAHNGKIWAESEPGKFTKFTLLLPKKPA